MQKSNIEWTDHTFNPWIGCTKVSPGCARCYAEKLMDTRYKRVRWGKGQPRSRTSAANWKLPLKWNREAGDSEAFHASEMPLHDEGDFPDYVRPRVFCASLADWLDDEVPLEWLADLLAVIHSTPNLDWLLLTKRPENCQLRMKQILAEIPRTNITWQEAQALCMAEAFAGSRFASNTCLNNVWIGTTVEDQARADERIPHLLDIPAKVRFLSCEPLLESLDLSAFMGESCTIGDTIQKYNSGIDWIICGGESGPGARPMDPIWARSLRDRCQAGATAFFFNQWGGTDKNATGRILDGRTWDEIPSAHTLA